MPVLTPDGPPIVPACQGLAVSLEVFDRVTGRTFILSPNPPPVVPAQ
jgi:hypothetical protein